MTTSQQFEEAYIQLETTQEIKVEEISNEYKFSIKCLLENFQANNSLLRARHRKMFKKDKPRGALPRRHLCTFRILIPYYFVPYIMPLCHSAIPPFHHSAIPPFRHSAIPLQYVITRYMYHRRC
jgi:hypothetical protein